MPVKSDRQQRQSNHNLWYMIGLDSGFDMTMIDPFQVVEYESIPNQTSTQNSEQH